MTANDCFERIGAEAVTEGQLALAPGRLASPPTFPTASWISGRKVWRWYTPTIPPWAPETWLMYFETGTRCSLGGADGPPGRCRAGSSCTTPSIVETVLAHDEPRAPGHGRARGWRRSASGLRLALIQAAALKVRAETGKGMTV